jgi:phage FluMu protein gp41
LILCLFPLSLLLLLVFIPAKSRQQTRVRQELQDILDNVAAEAEEAGTFGHVHPGARMNATPMTQSFEFMGEDPNALGATAAATTRITPLQASDLNRLMAKPEKSASETTSDSFFLRREGKVHGPLSRRKLSNLRSQKKLRQKDELACSQQGPWFLVSRVHRQVIDNNQHLPV